MLINKDIFINKIFKDLLIFILFIFISALFSIVFFKTPDWDFYSYHYYNGWAFLHDRINIDIMPCLFRSYFNPILDAITYLIIQKLNNHPFIFIVISSFKYGLLMFIAYKLYDFILTKLGNNNYITMLCCIVTAGASPIILYCISFDNTDIQIANIILIGIYIYIKNIFNNNVHKLKYIFLASLLFGAAFGLKYSCISSVIGILIATLCMYKQLNNPIRTFVYMSFGFILGFILTNGYWMSILLIKFHNPFFPYFNNIFNSPYADTNFIIKPDFYLLLPKNILDFILYPLKNSLANLYLGFERVYFDLKISMGFLSALILFMLIILKKDSLKIKNINYLCFLLLFISFAYYTNLLLFAQIRYIISLFILVPIIICMLIKVIAKQEYYYYCIVLFLFLFFVTYANYSRAHSYNIGEPYKVINISNAQFKDNSLVFCANFATCFIAPFQNDNVKYIGLTLSGDIAKKGYWTTVSDRRIYYYPNKIFENNVSELISNNADIYFVYSKSAMGKHLEDVQLYEEMLSDYFKNEIKLDNCEDLEFSLFDIINKDRVVCILKGGI